MGERTKDLDSKSDNQVCCMWESVHLKLAQPSKRWRFEDQAYTRQRHGLPRRQIKPALHCHQQGRSCALNITLLYIDLSPLRAHRQRGAKPHPLVLSGAKGSESSSIECVVSA
ncbi:hypothetical protein VTK26DRAFT_4052 [Humicola hyalothermophila]